MALSEASKEAIHLRNSIFESTGKMDYVVLYNDSQGAQKIFINPVFHKRSKHIDVRHHFIGNAVSNQIVNIKYLPTDRMIADILTKGSSNIEVTRSVISLDLKNT